MVLTQLLPFAPAPSPGFCMYVNVAVALMSNVSGPTFALQSLEIEQDHPAEMVRPDDTEPPRWTRWL